MVRCSRNSNSILVRVDANCILFRPIYQKREDWLIYKFTYYHEYSRISKTSREEPLDLSMTLTFENNHFSNFNFFLFLGFFLKKEFWRVQVQLWTLSNHFFLFLSNSILFFFKFIISPSKRIKLKSINHTIYGGDWCRLAPGQFKGIRATNPQTIGWKKGYHFEGWGLC